MFHLHTEASLRWIAGFLNPMTIVCSVSGYNSRYRIYISFFRIKDCVAGYRGAGAAYRGSGTGRAVRIAIIRDRRNFRYVFIVYSNCRRGRLAAGRYRNYSLTGTQTGYKTISSTEAVEESELVQLAVRPAGVISACSWMLPPTAIRAF